MLLLSSKLRSISHSPLQVLARPGRLWIPAGDAGPGLAGVKTVRSEEIGEAGLVNILTR